MESKAVPEDSSAFGETFDFRNRLGEMFANSPLPKEELMFNLGLYVRSSLLVKFLVLNDLYLRFKSVPGALIEFGTWWGQNLILLENLRAIHEPFNKQRTIIGFDTFSGYPEKSGMSSEATKTYGGYKTAKDYAAYLGELLEVHEGNNAFGHNRGGHKLIAGDVEQTAPQYFADHPETFVAFAFFDIGPYKPSVAALRSINPTCFRAVSCCSTS
jgi:hypothetical protein